MAYRNDRNDVAEVLVRALKSLVVHAAVAAVPVAIFITGTNAWDDASDKLQRQYTGTESAEATVLSVLSLAREQLFWWLVLSMVVSLLASVVFISIVQGRDPRFDEEQSSRLAAWSGLFLGTIAATGALWWWLVSKQGVAMVLVENSYAHALWAAFIAVPAAFWLATGLAVTFTMRPSVPGGRFFPSFWN